MIKVETQAQAQKLIGFVKKLHNRALQIEKNYQPHLSLVTSEYQPSARNLLHYLAIRQSDIRNLQNDLASLGLSSLGRLEVSKPIHLVVDDTLVLTPSRTVGKHALRDENGGLLTPSSIPCTLDAAFLSVNQGDRIWLDDGKIGGIVLDNNKNEITIRIVHAPPQGANLRAEKGINLPDSILDIPSLSEKDLHDLLVLSPHIDTVGLSFVRSTKDVESLHAELDRLGANHVGVVLKIETKSAFAALPELLLTAMRRPIVGVMVARGDLAVETGFERLAEVQEEILWFCEAAHVPVIWATQVLENLAKTGQPTRSEVSDAVMSGRAECVMLNKGPYITSTVQFLSNILERMDAHQSKKRSMLRKLSVSEFSGDQPASTN